ncbi:MAG: sodium-dependent transporter [Psychromonas sp.]|nr:sodium-dependent transporter [Psychromonas sp.]
MEREQWGSRVGFILATIGSAIGLGNIWRFPYITYENGGGAFLIPYLFAMITVGIPFMILEFGMGHKYKGTSPHVFAHLNSKFAWLGWFQVFIAIIIMMYYSAIIGWTLSYFSMSFTQAWGTDPNAFFYTKYLKLGSNHSPTALGSLQPHIVLAMLIEWTVCFIAIFTGIKSGIERLNKVMMPLLFIMILALIGKMIMMPGALTGINYLFKPDFSKISDPKVWSAAYGQIFFTLSVGFSIMIAYSSYLPKKSDISNNALMTVLINCGFSILAGIMIFAILGNMAYEQSKPMADVVTSGIGLAFVTIPSAINTLPFPYIIGPLFFFTLVIAGISSHLSVIEAVTASIMDKFKISRKKSVIIVCGIAFVVSLAFATNGGLLLLDIIDYFINNFALLLSCLFELVIMGWIIKLNDIHEHVDNISDFKIGNWFEICLRFISPLFLIVIIASNIYFTLTDGYKGYSKFDLLIFGWGLTALILVIAVLINKMSKEEI